jgi:acetyl esterase/lipase
MGAPLSTAPGIDRFAGLTMPSTWPKWIAITLLLLGLGSILAFRLIPEPGVWVIRQVFNRGDAELSAASAAHVPPDVVARRDLRYGAGPDERFDLFLPPPGTPRKPLLVVWVHGGGFVAGDKSSVANWLSVLAGRGYPVVSVEYTRGASRAYPLPVRQANAALAHVRANAASLGVDPSAIVLGGDSAGAHIAGQLALSLSNPAYARALGVDPAVEPDALRAMLLTSGIYDMPDLSGGGLIGAFLRSAFHGYTGETDPAKVKGIELFSIPDNADARFPPSFITGGNADPLTAQGKALAARLAGLGVETDTLFFPDSHQPPLAHEYQLRLNTADGRLAFERMVAFLDRQALSRKSPPTGGPA